MPHFNRRYTKVEKKSPALRRTHMAKLHGKWKKMERILRYSNQLEESGILNEYSDLMGSPLIDAVLIAFAESEAFPVAGFTSYLHGCVRTNRLELIYRFYALKVPLFGTETVRNSFNSRHHQSSLLRRILYSNRYDSRLIRFLFDAGAVLDGSESKLQSITSWLVARKNFDLLSYRLANSPNQYLMLSEVQSNGLPAILSDVLQLRDGQIESPARVHHLITAIQFYITWCGEEAILDLMSKLNNLSSREIRTLIRYTTLKMQQILRAMGGPIVTSGNFQFKPSMNITLEDRIEILTSIYFGFSLTQRCLWLLPE